jgi:hypothetical protein
MSPPRAARAAATVVFLLTGAVMAGWATRLPTVQERLGLSAAEVGLAVTGLELGAVTSLSTALTVLVFVALLSACLARPALRATENLDEVRR